MKALRRSSVPVFHARETDVNGPKKKPVPLCRYDRKLEEEEEEDEVKNMKEDKKNAEKPWTYLLSDGEEEKEIEEGDEEEDDNHVDIASFDRGRKDALDEAKASLRREVRRRQELEERLQTISDKLRVETERRKSLEGRLWKRYDEASMSHGKVPVRPDKVCTSHEKEPVVALKQREEATSWKVDFRSHLQRRLLRADAPQPVAIPHMLEPRERTAYIKQVPARMLQVP